MMKRALELYIHIPFCVRKCAYCDFLSFSADENTWRAYVEALLDEIRQWKDRGDHEISTVFFGGGTPSLLPAGYIRKIMGALREKFAFLPDAEISIECNPGTLDREKLEIYRACGFNRISLGLQSAQDGELKMLGRIHSYGEFLESVRLARAAGFDNLNVDLMSALPGQTTETWMDTLRRAVQVRPEHISAYSLMIEEGTPFYERYAEAAERRSAGEDCAPLPSEEEERRMYYLTEEYLKKHGYCRYEISNYALPGRACRHNCGYWQRVEYKGFGLGAASLVGEERSSNTAEMDAYLKGKREGSRQRLSREEQMEETMFLGLRMQKGVSEKEFAGQFGVSMQSVYGQTLDRLISQGLLKSGRGTVTLTGRGIDISNYVLAQFLF